MFSKKNLAEKRVEEIRKKWKNYVVPKDAINKCAEVTEPVTNSIMDLIETNQKSNPKKIEKEFDELGKLLGLFSRDCFLTGLEFGSYKIIDELTEIFIIVSDQLVRFSLRHIAESVRLGNIQNSDQVRATQAALEQITRTAKATFNIGVGYSPTIMAQEQVPTNSSNHLDKNQYYFAHKYFPRILFEFPQKVYEILTSEGGDNFLLYLWSNSAKEIQCESMPSELKLSREKIDSTHEVIIVHMPKPQKIPEAFYGAAVFGLEYYTIIPKVVSVQYFTLELGQKPNEAKEEFYFCEWTKLDEHTNYGTLPQKSMQEFVQCISSILKS